ncbi:hypothetical protein BJY01DRAFT_41471 [Aspergillus pseudoustus]|uniref:Uncharacterized protein n=1 Tax=Aspergillus pseudoustus TaxID=1810923 RepID=A0ABR4JC48_9EURO
MRTTTLLLPVLAALSGTTTACTFGIEAIHNSNTADGSGGIRCIARIWADDLEGDGVIDDAPQAANGISCSEGSGTVDDNGQTYEFKWGTFDNVEIEDGETITVQRTSGDSAGALRQIWPGGSRNDYDSSNPFASFVATTYWMAGIDC